MTTATATLKAEKVGRFEIRFDAQHGNWDIIDTRTGEAPGYGDTLDEAKQLAREWEVEARKEDLKEEIATLLDDASAATLRKLLGLLKGGK